MKQIVIFASGTGTNALNIVNFYKNNKNIQVLAIYTNNINAGVIKKCIDNDIKCRIFDKEEWQSGIITNELKNAAPDLIVLAGFLWLIPSELINLFPNKIVNIHPALLPKYGGKGMYGDNVHKAVINNKDLISGITIHYVNEKYDEGEILFQARVNVLPNDTHLSLAKKIHVLEYKHYPLVIDKILIQENREEIT